MTAVKPSPRGRHHGVTMLRHLLPLAALLAACMAEPPPAPLPVGDMAAFAATVQPVLDLRCADPSCHGRVDRPLSVYSPGRFRRDPTRTFRLEPLDDDELAANARALAAFALEAGEVARCQVLCKPLAPGAGGCGHAGGVIFASRDEREFRALADWFAALRWTGGGP